MNLSNCAARLFIAGLILFVLVVGAYSVLAFLFVLSLALLGVT